MACATERRQQSTSFGATHRERGAGAYRVQFGDQLVRCPARAVVVHDDTGARCVQPARHGGAEPLRSARDEDAAPGRAVADSVACFDDTGGRSPCRVRDDMP